jgi:transposase
MQIGHSEGQAARCIAKGARRDRTCLPPLAECAVLSALRQKLGSDGLTSASRADANVRCWRKVVIGLNLIHQRVRIPTPEQEEAKRLYRERRRLVRERGATRPRHRGYAP